MSVTSGEVLYAAAGDLPKILPTLLGRELGVGQRLLLKDVDLRSQRLKQVTSLILDSAPDPVSSQMIVGNKHGESFRATVLQEARGVVAPAQAFWVTETEMVVIDDWHLTDFGWQRRANLAGRDIGRSSTVEVAAHVLLGDQVSDDFAHHNKFDHEIFNPTSLGVAADINALHSDALASQQNII